MESTKMDEQEQVQEYIAEPNSSRKRIITVAILTYLFVFAATLGFTGVVDYGKAVKPVVKGAQFVGKLFEKSKKKENKKELPTDAVTPIQPIDNTPLTMPGTVSEVPTQSVQNDPEQQKITEANAADLAKVYSNMDSDKAAEVFASLTDEEIILLVRFMQKSATAEIFGEMESARVAKITSKMVGIENDYSDSSTVSQ